MFTNLLCKNALCLFSGQGRGFYWTEVFMHWSDGAQTMTVDISIPSGKAASGVI